MKTLHLYLLKQVLATLIMTVAVFVFVLLLGNFLKEILQLLVNRQATLGGVITAMGLLMPFVLAFALPMGMMTAALLVFGRFSADQELTAVRSSGISLVSLVSPILVLSLLVCGLSAWINMEIAPRCRVAYKGIVDTMLRQVTHAALPEGRYVKNGDYSFFIGGIDGEQLRDVYIFHVDSNHFTDLSIQAEYGRETTTNGHMIVKLFNANKLERNSDGSWVNGAGGEMTMDRLLTDTDTKTESVAISDMTFGQLREQLRNVEASFSLPSGPGVTHAELLDQKRKLENMKSGATMPILVQIHRQVASSFASFGFTLVGIPLGIRAHRRETNMGVAMALLLVLVYYSFMILGQSLQTHAELAPYLILWIPNFIFQTVGAVMLWRANKGI